MNRFLLIFFILVESLMPLRAEPDPSLVALSQTEMECLIVAVQYYKSIAPNNKIFSVAIRNDIEMDNPAIQAYTFNELRNKRLRHFGGNGKYFLIYVSKESKKIIFSRWVRDK